jgi:hypothetical protein
MHLMPWELDDASNVFNKIAIANKYLSPDDKLTVDTCLNLSSYIIDWDKSIIPKEFYINKYNYINKVFYEINHKCNIYDKNELYGHLDFQREVTAPHIDYYILILPVGISFVGQIFTFNDSNSRLVLVTISKTFSY